MKKAMLLVNPTAGNESAPDFKDKLFEKLNGHFDQVDVIETEYAGHITDFDDKACKEKYEAFFVMGGDGSVSEAIAGLAENKDKPKFGFLPLGTVNDLARALGIDIDPLKAIEELDLTKPLTLYELAVFVLNCFATAPYLIFVL